MTVHKLNLENIARDAVARFAGQAQAFAVKDEIDATPAEIEALRARLERAIDGWKTEKRIAIEIKGIELVRKHIDEAQKRTIGLLGCQWQGTENPNAEPQP